ncbi:hypothetical protein ACKVWM_004989 [Pyricularia oryzae]
MPLAALAPAPASATEITTPAATAGLAGKNSKRAQQRSWAKALKKAPAAADIPNHHHSHPGPACRASPCPKGDASGDRPSPPREGHRRKGRRQERLRPQQQQQTTTITTAANNNNSSSSKIRHKASGHVAKNNNNAQQRIRAKALEKTNAVAAATTTTPDPPGDAVRAEAENEDEDEEED